MSFRFPERSDPIPVAPLWEAAAECQKRRHRGAKIKLHDFQCRIAFPSHPFPAETREEDSGELPVLRDSGLSKFQQGLPDRPKPESLAQKSH
jgi:hypothetical protein